MRAHIRLDDLLLTTTQLFTRNSAHRQAARNRYGRYYCIPRGQIVL